MKSYTLGVGVLFVALAIVASVSYGTEDIPYEIDSGYVTDSHSVQDNVIVYETLRHNHWEAGGTVTFEESVSTGNAWSVGAAAGYTATTEVKVGVLAEVTAKASVSVEINGEYSGSKSHTWTVTDTVEKQHCKCFRYRAWVDKPTETGHRTIEYWMFPPDGGPDYPSGEPTVSASGSGTGDTNDEAGVVNNYTFGQDDTDECDCYENSNTCPGV